MVGFDDVSETHRELDGLEVSEIFTNLRSGETDVTNLDDSWRGAGAARDDFQRTVQGIAMVVTGSTPPEAMSAITSQGATPEAGIGTAAVDFLLGTPSLNIIPF